MTKAERYDQILRALTDARLTAMQVAAATGQHRVVASRYLADLVSLGRVRIIPGDERHRPARYVIRITPGPKPSRPA